jgi:hypothetical protein
VLNTLLQAVLPDWRVIKEATSVLVCLGTLHARSVFLSVRLHATVAEPIAFSRRRSVPPPVCVERCRLRELPRGRRCR